MNPNKRIITHPAWRRSVRSWLCVTGALAIMAGGLSLRPVSLANRSELDAACLGTAPASGLPEAVIQDTAAPAGAAGYRIFKDPFTRKFTPPPENLAVLQPTGALAVAFSTSGDGLQAVRSVAANGGWVLNLRGRFQNGLVATLNPEGGVTARCVAGAEGLPGAVQPAE